MGVGGCLGFGHFYKGHGSFVVVLGGNWEIGEADEEIGEVGEEIGEVGVEIGEVGEEIGEVGEPDLSSQGERVRNVVAGLSNLPAPHDHPLGLLGWKSCSHVVACGWVESWSARSQASGPLKND